MAQLIGVINVTTGVAPPSFRKGVDGWDFMKNKIGG
jgi:hypothetical protein